MNDIYDWLESVTGIHLDNGQIPKELFPVFLALQEKMEKLQQEFSRSVAALNNYAADAIESAKIDPGTKLYNRRILSGEIPVLLEKLQRDNVPLCIQMMDIDYFKSVNDTYGHAKGDQILLEIADILNTSFRNSDISIRYGGDEYLTFLPGIDLAMAKEIIERVRAKILENVRLPDGRSVTVSVGVTQMLSGDSLTTLTRRADALLYRSKERGRNCVTVGMESDLENKN